MEEVRGGPVGPFEDLEVIRVEAGVSTARFCHLFDMPERTWRRWQARARAGGQPKGPWPTRHSATEVTLRHALAHPAWGHRKVWAMVRHDGTVCPRRPCCGCCATRARIGILEGFAPTAQNPHTGALVEVNNGVLRTWMPGP